MTNAVTKTHARPAWAAELNDQEWLFVEAYLDSLNATPAARAAGFAKSSANVQGHRPRRHTRAPAARWV
jgi:phage terminase small subunit